MSGSRRSELYRLLCLAEDYVLDGFRHEHPRLIPSATSATVPPRDRPVPSEGRPAPSASTAPPGSAAWTALRASAGSGVPSEDSLESLSDQVRACRRCALHERRTQAVPGEGAPQPLVLVVGEGPGFEEDRTGRPFVGPAGQYLDKWLQAIGLDRSEGCYITNVVKCRPPGNRDPLPDESAACRPYLERQIVLLQPRAILTVGRISTQILTGGAVGIGALRGRRHEYRGVPLVGTYHPSAVLRNPSLRKPVWEDLKLLRAIIEAPSLDE